MFCLLVSGLRENRCYVFIRYSRDVVFALCGIEFLMCLDLGIGVCCVDAVLVFVRW